MLLSGSIYPETGAELLFEAIQRLAEGPAPLRLHLTGTGPSLERFCGLGNRDGSVSVSVHHRMLRHDYEALLTRIHAGLSLKLIDSPLADTTFPSKTVEYAEHGMLLIATDISDVRKVFGETALYLDRDDPDALAALIAEAARDRQGSRDMAAAGQRRIAEHLAPQIEGARLRSFLFGGGG